MAVIGFTGSEELKKYYSKIVSGIVKEVESRGDTIAVGDCETGLDLMVTGSSTNLYALFYLFDDKDGNEAKSERAIRMIEASDEIIVFADTVCLYECHPSNEFTGFDSIDVWGSAAYAIGIGKKVSVVWCSKGEAILPAWFIGNWEQSKKYGGKAFDFEINEKKEQMKLF